MRRMSEEWSSYWKKEDKNQMIQDMLHNMKSIKTLKFRLKKQERIDGKMIRGDQIAKVQVSPFKVYVKVFEPDKGAEVLYVSGQRDGDALVNPNKFPYVNLNLSPYGGILRKNQHHTIHELGFNYMHGIVKDAYNRFKDKVDEFVIYEGMVEWNGQQCHKVIIDNKDFAWENYTVKNGEDVLDIAKENFVSEYMIMEHNKSIDDYDDVDAGQTIKIPNTYCRKIVFYLDKETLLPIYQKLWDDKGLFAEYEYHNLELNPSISSAEFTSDYEDYDY